MEMLPTPLDSVMMCEMDSCLSAVSGLSIMGGGRRRVFPKVKIRRVDATSDWSAGRHTWQSLAGDSRKLVNSERAIYRIK